MKKYKFDLQVEFDERPNSKFLKLFQVTKSIRAMVNDVRPYNGMIGKDILVKSVREIIEVKGKTKEEVIKQIQNNNNNNIKIESESDMGHGDDYMSRPERLSLDDLIRALNAMITEEQEAILFYSKVNDEIGNSAKNSKNSAEFLLVHKVVKEIIEEEIRHVGKLQTALFEICPTHKKYFMEGVDEVKKMLGEKHGD